MENNRYKQVNHLYEVIEDFMVECKNRDNTARANNNARDIIGEGWKECLRKLIADMDAIEAIELYVCLTKYGFTEQFIQFISSDTHEDSVHKLAEIRIDNYLFNILSYLFKDLQVLSN